MFYLDFGVQFIHEEKGEKTFPHSAITTGDYVIEAACVEWRIDDIKSGRVLATCEDDNRAGGPAQVALGMLTGATIVDIRLKNPGLDCSVEFDNSLILEFFPVQVKPYDNYSLWYKDDVFEVGPRSSLTFGKFWESFDYERGE